MNKTLCYLLILSIYQISFAPPEGEETTQTTEVTTHKSLEDDSWANIFRRAKNTIGDRFGFGDLHKAKTLLAKPQAARTDEENTQLADSFRNLDSREKTEAINEAIAQRRKLLSDTAPNEIKGKSLSDTVSKEIIAYLHHDEEIKTADNSTDVKIINTQAEQAKREAQQKNSPEKQKALNIIKEYIQDPNNQEKQAQAKNTITKEFLDSLTDAEKKELIPNFFKLSKLFDKFDGLTKRLLKPFIETDEFTKFTTDTIDQFIENPNDATLTAHAKFLLLEVCKSRNISKYFSKHFTNPIKDATLNTIQKLIGPDNVIIECDLPGASKNIRRMILNTDFPVFTSELITTSEHIFNRNQDQALQIALFLSQPTRINQNVAKFTSDQYNRNAITTNLQMIKRIYDRSMNEDTQTEFKNKLPTAARAILLDDKDNMKK